jgi:glycosyltransferase involved in cell wall biosynthesis
MGRHIDKLTKIVFFRDFAEDGFTSMEVYADHLVTGVAREWSELCQIDEHRPRIPASISALPLGQLQRLRMARYIGYPVQAWRRRGDLNHVIDHGYAHLIWPLGAKRTVVTVHDLIPLLLAKGAIPGVRADRPHPLAEFSSLAVKRACHLIAISNNTKRDVIRHLGCDPERISVIYWGIDASFKPYPENEKIGLRTKFGLPTDGVHLVLASGTSFYKNEETSLTVAKRLQEICSKPVALVRLGPITPTWRENVRINGMNERVVELVGVPHENMWELYNAVDCLLFPSWYEGLGLPPIEAMACGIPVVTSNAAALPESVGEAGLMAAPDDVKGLAEAVRTVLEDPLRRHEQIARGISHAREFTWERTVRQTLRVYEKVLEQKVFEGEITGA